MKKRILSLFLSLLLILNLCPVVPLNAATASGELTDTIGWSLSEDGTLTITGTGNMPGYSDSTWSPWDSDAVKTVIIGEGITSIGSETFMNSDALVMVDLPSTLTNIYAYAFYGCTALTSITLPEGLTYLGTQVFGDCSALATVHVPSSLTSYSQKYALNLPFAGCTSITTIQYGGTKAKWEQYALSGMFDSTVQTRVTVQYPAVTTVASGTGWTLTSDGVLTITGTGEMPDYTSYNAPWYSYVEQITSIVVENGVTAVGDYAFYSLNKVTSAVLPDGLTAIGADAFWGCSALASINIPDSVTEIGNYAFSGCAFTAISLPDGLTAIGTGAFNGCTKLTTITIPEGVTALNYYTFSDCSALASVTLSEGVTSIGDAVFQNCTALTSITIPEGVTHLGTDAFTGCSALKTVYLPKSLTSYGTNYYHFPFYSLFSIADIYYNGTKTDFKQNKLYGMFTTTVQEKATFHFTYPSGQLTDTMSWALSADGTLTITGTGEMPDYTSNSPAPWHSYAEQITSIVVENGVTGLGNYAFTDLSKAASVTLPDSLTSIGETAFDGCAALTSITIPESVTDIGKYAFRRCTGLTTFAFPEGVTTVKGYIFHGCTGLTFVTLPEGVTTIRDGAFNGCTSLASVTLPAGVTEVGEYVFGGCTALSSVTLPKSLTTYDADNIPFSGCAAITGIYYGSSKAEWEEYDLSGMFDDSVQNSANIHFAVSTVTFDALPAKLVYAKGEALSLDGLAVTADGQDVTASVTFTGYDANTVGKQTVTLAFGTFAQTYEVYVFGFTGVTLTLEGKIAVNFYAQFPGADRLYIPAALVFTEEPSEADIQAAYDAGKSILADRMSDGSYRIVWDDVAAKEMNDLLYIVPVAALNDGSAVFGKVSSISPAQYVQSAFDTYQDEALRTMLVDMLNYGAAAQIHFGYRTDALANAGLTDAQLALGTQVSPTVTSQYKLYAADALTDSAITLTGASLTLENELSINFYANAAGKTVAAADLLLFDGYDASTTMNAAAASAVIPMVKNGASWQGIISNIPVKLVRQPYCVRICFRYADGTVGYSAPIRYSVETYAHTLKTGSYTLQTKNLADRLMRYGDSAAAYFAAP